MFNLVFFGVLVILYNYCYYLILGYFIILEERFMFSRDKLVFFILVKYEIKVCKKEKVEI